MKNFVMNRTTNERFAGKKYKSKVKSLVNTEISGKSGATEEDAYSTTTSLLAEELVKEIGEPEDYSHRPLSCFFNVFAMCCSTKMPDQLRIYNELRGNRYDRHRNTIVNFDQFNQEIQDIRIPRRQSEFNLYLDPFDNQGVHKSFKIGMGSNRSRHASMAAQLKEDEMLIGNGAVNITE